MNAPAAPLVVDTNVVLDLLVFDDAPTRPLRDWLDGPGPIWLATAAMRDELARVLAYPAIARALAARGRTAGEVLAQWEARVTLVPPAPDAGVRCSDADDQMYADLAVARQATLLSRDQALLCMKKRLATRMAAVLSATKFIANGFSAPPG